MHREMISIWFFIGLLLLAYGLLICGSGIYELFRPPAHPVVMADLHAPIWWGAFLFVIGVIYSIRFAPKRK
jgi:hypothetical protein